MTALDLITGSLRLLGVLSSGDVPTANESTDGLTALNQMIGSWSVESLLIYTKAQETFTMIASQQSYTVGSGGNFNTTRPQKIENAAVRTTNGSTTLDLPIEIINQDQWSNISVKTVQSTLPRKLFAQGTYPLETIYLWPTPSTGNTLVLWSWKPLSSFATINSSVDLPQGYVRALRYNLALELAPEYGSSPNPLVIAEAEVSKAAIKRMNIKTLLLSQDESLARQGRGFNYLTGE